MNSKNISEIAYNHLINDLNEDLHNGEKRIDLTTNILIKKKTFITAYVSNREKIVLCGIKFISSFLKKKFPKIKATAFFDDGIELKKNKKILCLQGDCKTILSFERTILNFLQHLSGISTYTRKYTKLLEKKNIQILDTRKTLPGLRKIQKYATFVGGANNHRMGLFDEIMIKDNHIKIIGGIEKTLEKIKKENLKAFKIECESFDEVKKALQAEVKYILLDNMTPKEILRCIKLKEKLKLKTKFEITGGIDFSNIKKFSSLGADFISIGKITNSTKSVDIGLDIL